MCSFGGPQSKRELPPSNTAAVQPDSIDDFFAIGGERPTLSVATKYDREHCVFCRFSFIPKLAKNVSVQCETYP